MSDAGPVSYTVAVVDAARTRELRRAVLRPALSPGDPLPGDDVAGGVHVAALDADGTAIGTCLIYAEACPWRPREPVPWRLRAMATDPARRGAGVGAAVLAVALDEAARAGATYLWLKARERAVPFYARHGLEPHGAPFDDAETGIAHLAMGIALSREPSAAPSPSTT